MPSSISFALFMLMGASVLMLTLEAIARNRPGASEKPHIRLLAILTVLTSLLMLAVNLMGQEQLSRRPLQFIDEIASAFLIINTGIAIFLGRKSFAKNQSGEIYFLILAALALSIAMVSHPSLFITLVSGTGWLLVMTTLAVRTTEGGKKAEIGLKLVFSTMIFMILLTIALFLLNFSMANVYLDSVVPNEVGIIALILVALASLSYAGTPPFHFGHVDCADGGNVSVAFLLLTNSFVQGGMLLLKVKAAMTRSGLDRSNDEIILGIVMIIGFLILWLRALDQSKVRRMAAYIATSMGPLFFMSTLFGASVLLPKLVFYVVILSFVTLTLFALYGSLAYMEPINSPWQTWEEISGFGRINPQPTLTFIVAIASIAGLPGTLGYFVKLSLIAPLQDNLIFSGAIFLSIAIGAACMMRVFVFMFAKHAQIVSDAIPRPPMILLVTAVVLVTLGFFPFVR